MMGRIAERNKQVMKQLKCGTAFPSKDAQGRRKVNMLNTEKKKVRRNIIGTRIFYNCPKCGKVLSYKKKMHQGLCMNCGQRLDWCDYDDMPSVWLLVHDSDEAGYWAAQYEAINSTTYGINIDEWRLIHKDYPLLLFFPFPEGKDYGRFMRKATKEATIIKDVNERNLL
jgi:hypothetical protein